MLLQTSHSDPTMRNHKEIKKKYRKRFFFFFTQTRKKKNLSIFKLRRRIFLLLSSWNSIREKCTCINKIKIIPTP